MDEQVRVYELADQGLSSRAIALEVYGAPEFLGRGVLRIPADQAP